MEQHAQQQIESHMQACALPVLGDTPSVADTTSLQTLLGVNLHKHNSADPPLV